MPSRLNQLIVREMKTRFSGVDTYFFVDFTGLNGRKAADLRHQLRAACGGRAALTVVRPGLAKRAFAELEPTAALAGGALDEGLRGPTALVYGADDPVVLARTLADWGKKENLVRFKGGVLDGRALPADACAALAKIPPRPVLMAQVVGVIAAPLTALLGVAQGVIRQMLSVMDALAKKKSESASE